MKVLSTVGAAAVSGFWKLGAIAALGVTIATGAGWALAARDRDVARADIVKERKVSADLTAAVGTEHRRRRAGCSDGRRRDATRGGRESRRSRHRTQRHPRCCGSSQHGARLRWRTQLSLGGMEMT